MNKYQEALETLCEAITQRKHFVIKLAIGNLNELIEKATPMKAIVNGIREGREINTVSYTCPSCNNHIGRDNFCKYCGQALLWGEEDVD